MVIYEYHCLFYSGIEGDNGLSRLRDCLLFLLYCSVYLLSNSSLDECFRAHPQLDPIRRIITAKAKPAAKPGRFTIRCSCSYKCTAYISRVPMRLFVTIGHIYLAASLLFRNLIIARGLILYAALFLCLAIIVIPFTLLLLDIVSLRRYPFSSVSAICFQIVHRLAGTSLQGPYP